jgi:hypothetical protein
VKIVSKMQTVTGNQMSTDLLTKTLPGTLFTRNIVYQERCLMFEKHLGHYVMDEMEMSTAGKGGCWNQRYEVDVKPGNTMPDNLARKRVPAVTQPSHRQSQPQRWKEHVYNKQ